MNAPMISPDSPDFSLGVVGAGLMGGGIAQLAAQAGIKVLLFDAQTGAATQARERIAAAWKRLEEKGKLNADARLAALACLQPVDSLAAMQPCHVVIEAIVENLAIKQTVFRELESIVAPSCVLATNTSSLSVTAIAAACAEPARVAGFHFFSPVPLMKLVEVVQGIRTSPQIADTLVALALRMGHTPVRAQDTPGFIVNHAGRGYGTEALRLIAEGVAEFHEIDRILRDGAGFRMGPFELLDLTGLDVSQPVMESIYHQYYEEPRFRPSPLLLQRKHAGLLGRKTGEGFYRYVEGTPQLPAPAPIPNARPARVWVSGRRPAARVAVVELLNKLGALIDAGDRPAGNALCIVTPLGEDATSAAHAENLDPVRTIAIDTLFGLATCRTLMKTPVTSTAMQEAALGLFQHDGVPAVMVRDSAGFVAQRTMAHIVNIACDMAQQRVATPADIDRATTLGLGYRQGPLALGDSLGAGNVLAILDALYVFYGDPRYRASPWLRRRAALGVSLLAPDS
jgi:3-hydroxybutyryl-CoA dehydrogenase